MGREGRGDRSPTSKEGGWGGRERVREGREGSGRKRRVGVGNERGGKGDALLLRKGEWRGRERKGGDLQGLVVTSMFEILKNAPVTCVM